MKNILMLLLSSCITINCLGQLSKTEKDKMLIWAYPDSKEEVTVTKDNGDGFKIWSLVDGKLLFKYEKGDASVLSKFIRYGVQEPGFLERSLNSVNVWNGESRRYKYKFGQYPFIDFDVPLESICFTTGHHNTRQVAYSYYEKGSILFYVANGPDDATYCNECKFEEIAKIKTDDNKYVGVDFSPSGKYLYSCRNTSETVCMIDIESKKVLWKNKKWRDLKSFHSLFVFNKLETQCAIGYNVKGILIFDVQSGELVDSILIPPQFKKLKNASIYPNSDMKSFVLMEWCYKDKDDMSDCSPKAWLIKKDEIIELYDKE